MFLVFFENLNASFTMNAELINALYTNSATTVSTIFIAALTTQFATFFATQTMQFSTLRATITTTFQQSYVSAVSGFITPTRAQAMNMVAQLKSQFAMLRAAIVSDFNQAAAGARNAFASLASWFRSAVYAPIVSMLSSLNSQINSTISRANSAAASVASLGRVRYYASGGFVPNHGQVFVAREQGPELVGRIGNQSAVANNNQIIAGIKQGVYEAMMASNSGGRSGDINLYVSGKQIMTAVAEEARRETVRTGVNPLTQGG
jgi:hypothetical protein